MAQGRHLVYHSSVFAFLEKIDPVVDRVTDMRAYRISVVSDEGLPDAIEFVPPRDSGFEMLRWRAGDKPVKIGIDLKLLCDYFVCEEEHLHDGFIRYTFVLSEVALELPGAVSLVPIGGESEHND